MVTGISWHMGVAGATGNGSVGIKFLLRNANAGMALGITGFVKPQGRIPSPFSRFAYFKTPCVPVKLKMAGPRKAKQGS